MVQSIDKRLKGRFHWPLLWVTTVLCAIGLLTLYSASFTLGQETMSHLFISQMVSFGVGFALLLIFSFIDYRLLERGAFLLYGLSLFSLVAVLIFGKTIAGHKSWLVVGSFSVQPSEFAKIGLVLVLAKYFSMKAKLEKHSIRNLGIPFLLLLAPVTLIILEKDLGTGLFFILFFSSYLFYVGMKRKTVLILVFLTLTFSWVAYANFLSPYQQSRIQTFVNPSSNPKGEGYHITQSKIAVGSGKMFGRGYLKGMHNKLLYLPEKHSDFIFPVLAEEWGMLGSTVVLTLYFLWIFFGFGVASKAKDRFGVFLAFGLASLFFWQIMVNLGGVLGLIPLTGVTLPLLSYGGSSVLTILISVGILLNIWMRRFVF